MPKLFIHLLILLFSSLIFVQTVLAQKETECRLSGIIKNDSGEPVSSASLQVKGTSQAAISTDDGFFTITGISPGKYKIIVSHVSYATYTVDISISEGDNTLKGDIILHPLSHELEDVVITATRTKKNISDVAVPITVIDREEIDNMASPRLDEILAEQTGITITSEEGVQVQGFDHKYTLIMINGDPIIGKLKGDDYLNRITVNNIKQIEIIKGPTSSLYGNEAIAGVINIITEDPQEGFDASLKAMARSHNTYDLNGDMNIKYKKAGINFNVNNYSSDGYDLDPENNLQTVPSFLSTTLDGTVYYQLNDKIRMSVNGKYFKNHQDNEDMVTIDTNDYVITADRDEQEWNGVFKFDCQFNSRANLEFKNYISGYSRETDYTYAEGDSLQDHTFTDQLYNKTEAQFNYRINENNEIVSGAGFIAESIESSSYSDQYNFNAKYLYGQHEWTPFNNKLNITTGVRYDMPSEYARKASPKLSVSYKLAKWITINGFTGTGFSAPEFKHLFIDYINPTSGFRIMGASIMKESIEALENAGMIDELYYDYTTWKTLKPESSISFNLGFSLTPAKYVTFKANAFRNDLKDMIGTTIIGTSNGSNIYVYENIESVFTQGIESDLNVSFFDDQLNLSAGYQYLEAKDKQVIEDIKDGKVFTTEPETRRLDLNGYGGLFNRSRHSGTFKVFYNNNKYKFNANVRVVYKGRYGEGDSNGNGILDIDSEYTPGYYIWYAGISKRLMDSFVIKTGVDNIFNYTNLNRTRIPGRILYFGIVYEFNNHK
ncbi:MAG: TonB-dependent receptor [Bacteroidales bacterium]|nr:TonB-dependent receptor [Bacteroidales bacterium]